MDQQVEQKTKIYGPCSICGDVDEVENIKRIEKNTSRMELVCKKCVKNLFP